MTPTSIDAKTPDLRFRIDGFSVPEAAREEFDAAMRRNLAFIRTLPGFREHLVFEKASGPTTLNVMTIAVWESQEAIDRAGLRVREHYRAIGFDMPAALARWNVRAEIGTYRELGELHGAP